MEAIDKKVRKLQIYSPGWGFTIRADKKELWKEVKRVLESQELESSKNKDKQEITVKSNEVSNIHKNKDKGKMKDNVISNTHANRDKQRMKIKDNVVSNIKEQKKILKVQYGYETPLNV
ncbi:uncharacterized protein LOC136070185 [Quercus suber]|uniref:uncharacterized protein LOC136070185 n=1 Tax=Quercus suber TaxID=58331 RepID=UPI0032DF78F9